MNMSQPPMGKRDRVRVIIRAGLLDITIITTTTTRAAREAGLEVRREGRNIVDNVSCNINY
jgi:hypothetical protein